MLTMRLVLALLIKLLKFMNVLFKGLHIQWTCGCIIAYLLSALMGIQTQFVGNGCLVICYPFFSLGDFDLVFRSLGSGVSRLLSNLISECVQQ